MTPPSAKCVGTRCDALMVREAVKVGLVRDLGAAKQCCIPFGGYALGGSAALGGALLLDGAASSGAAGEADASSNAAGASSLTDCPASPSISVTSSKSSPRSAK